MRVRALSGALAMVVAASSAPALAALGGTAASVESDRISMKAARRSTSAPNYTVQDLQTSDGTLIREYVSPAGKVFGVVWRGPQMPDLRQLFGDYFIPFQDAVTARRSERGPVRIVQPGLVVHSAGHMRAFYGRAYVPDFLPQGVNPDEIK